MMNIIRIKYDIIFVAIILIVGDSWSRSYGSSIYICIYDQCISPLLLRLEILTMAECTGINFMWWDLSVTWAREIGGLLRALWFPIPINVTVNILLKYMMKVAVNNLNQHCYYGFWSTTIEHNELFNTMLYREHIATVKLTNHVWLIGV